MRLKSLTIFFLVMMLSAVYAHDVNIRLLSTIKVTGVNISAASGRYQLYLNNQLMPDSMLKYVFQISVVRDSMEIRIPNDTLGLFTSLQLRALDDSSSFKIKPIKPMNGTRQYDHSLSIFVSAGQLEFRNAVDLEHYVAGVVESESGGRVTREYYKVQSILCRTYVLAHINRHNPEGFDLCDGVHCQFYRSRPSDPNVQLAVDDTRGLVLVDRGLNLITAAFHSNCGGQTANSEDVWAVALPYLRSTRDTFCLNMPNARWTRKIAREDWLSYLKLKHKYPVNDSDAAYSALNMTQDQRTTYYVYGNTRIPYKTIRSDWQLKSAYFSIEERNDSVIFRGRGYGHGVGLCQEGAINMAKRGYNYDWIIRYYYKDVEIVSLSKLDFFRED